MDIEAKRKARRHLLPMGKILGQAFAYARNLIRPDSWRDIGGLFLVVLGGESSQPRQPVLVQQTKPEVIARIQKFVQDGNGEVER